jgi:hypothetical protein
MTQTENHILQITDLVTTRRFAVRLDTGDAAWPLERLLDKYLKSPPLPRLLSERRITGESADALSSVQDLVYVSSDEGLLHGVFAGVSFKQGDLPLRLDETPPARSVTVDGAELLLLDVSVDRTSVGYDRNWKGFSRRRWMRHEADFSSFVRSTLVSAYGPGEAESVLKLDSTERKLRLVEALASRIWESDFESYSRFIGRKLTYKTGDETVLNIMEGGGGICSEKVQALKFLTDHFGLESEYVLAGANVPGPVPEARLRELLTTFDFRFAKRHMRYWQHTALLYKVDGGSVLVDATNGNIPFLFVNGAEADRLLGYDSKPAVAVKMAVHTEDFYYHRVSQDIPDNLFFAMEGWISHVDLVQVFDNELGLCITKDFMITPVVYRAEKTLERVRREYLAVCERAGLECEVSDRWDLDSDLAREFTQRHSETADKIIQAREHLLARYDDCHGPGHEAGLVVIKLTPGPAS